MCRGVIARCLDGGQAARLKTSMTGEPKKSKKLTPAAERALAEAAERRSKIDRKAAERPQEANGPAGPEPTRYGDWERKGMASDF